MLIIVVQFFLHVLNLHRQLFARMFGFCLDPHAAYSNACCCCCKTTSLVFVCSAFCKLLQDFEI
jgi:hypothetical protein